MEGINIIYTPYFRIGSDGGFRLDIVVFRRRVLSVFQLGFHQFEGLGSAHPFGRRLQLHPTTLLDGYVRNIIVVVLFFVVFVSVIIVVAFIVIIVLVGVIVVVFFFVIVALVIVVVVVYELRRRRWCGKRREAVKNRKSAGRAMNFEPCQVGKGKR